MAALAASLPYAPTRARAGSTAGELDAARGWFEQGIDAEERGDFAGALALFRKVAAVKLNHVVYFHLGLCLEHTGRLVAARDDFLLARSIAQHDGGVDADRIIAIAGKHLASLDARIPAVRVVAPKDAGSLEALSLTIDGTVMSASLLGAIVPLDPGRHVIEVHASGRSPFIASVDLVEDRPAPVDLVVTLPLLVDAPSAVASVAGDGGARPWPWITGAVGVTALAGAGVFYGLRASALAQVDATCAPGRVDCDPSLRDVAARGRTYATLGNVMLGVGLVSLGAAAVLIVTGRSDGRATATAAIEPVVGPLGFGVAGRF